MTCSAFAQATSRPIINSIYPNAVTPTAPPQYEETGYYDPGGATPPPSAPPDPVIAQITVTGSGFGSNPSTNFGVVSSVKANGTGFTLLLHPEDVSVAGILNLQVTNSGEASNSMPLVVSNSFSAPAFGSPVNIVSTGLVGASMSIKAIAVADLNKDGYPDVAIAEGQGVVIFLNNKAGNFARLTNIPYTGSNPVAIVAADLNNDGNMDLVVADSATRMLYSYLGKGNGNFAQPFSLSANHHSPLTTTPSGLAVGDFNGDGNPDVLVNYSDATASDTLYGTGSGTLNFAPGGMASGGGTNKAFAVGDFNGDGYLDFAVSSPSDEYVYIFLNDKNGSFLYGQQIQLNNAPNSIVAADFNGDGILDLAVANAAANYVWIYQGKSDGTFSKSSSVTVGNQPVGLAAADFNGDGQLDLAVAIEGTNTSVVILSGNNGSFTSSGTVWEQIPASSLAAADVNNDGRVDLVTMGSYGTTMVLQAAASQIELPALYDFPLSNWTAQTTLTIKNVGTAGLSISAISLPNGYGHYWALVTSSSCLTSSVPSGGSCTLVYNSLNDTGYSASTTKAANTSAQGTPTSQATVATQTVIVSKPFVGNGQFTIQDNSGTGTQAIQAVLCPSCYVYF